jgi:hypothetical protein
MIPFYFDIETIPDQTEGALVKCLEGIRPPGQYKKPESIQKWIDENADNMAAEAYHKTGLHGISGEICSIAWALGDSEPKSLLRGPAESEDGLLNAFFNQVDEQKTELAGHLGQARLRWIGHNIIGFDLRFLLQRCILREVRPEFHIPANARHGTDQVYDTMVGWCGWKGFISQDALAKAMGLKGKEGIDGSMVWDLYQMGEYDRIEEYNRDDVTTVRDIYKRMTFDGIDT